MALVENFNKKNNEYECYDDRIKYIAFTGYGKTSEEARCNYFSKTLIKNPNSIIINPGA